MIPIKFPNLGDVLIVLAVFLAVGGLIGGCLQNGCRCDGPGIHIQIGGTTTCPSK